MERDRSGSSKRPETLRDLVRQHEIDRLEELPPEILSTKRGNGLARGVARRQVEAALEQDDQAAAVAFKEAEKAIDAPKKSTPAQLALSRVIKQRLG